jgi:hypothetical protein
MFNAGMVKKLNRPQMIVNEQLTTGERRGPDHVKELVNLQKSIFRSAENSLALNFRVSFFIPRDIPSSISN